MSTEDLKPIIEAILFASGKPMTINQILHLFPEGEEPSKEHVEQAIEALQTEMSARPIELKEVGSGFRFQIKELYTEWVSRLYEEKPPKYSRALLETLALIVYRQPITRAEIEEIRGVAVSSHIIKTLQDRQWIKVVGHKDVPGKPAIYGTTKVFLDDFNIRSLDELPTLSELKDLDQLGLALEEGELKEALEQVKLQAQALPEVDTSDNAESNEGVAQEEVETVSEAENESASTVEETIGQSVVEGEDNAADEVERESDEVENELVSVLEIDAEDVIESAETVSVSDESVDEIETESNLEDSSNHTHEPDSEILEESLEDEIVDEVDTELEAQAATEEVISDEVEESTVSVEEAVVEMALATEVEEAQEILPESQAQSEMIARLVAGFDHEEVAEQNENVESVEALRVEQAAVSDSETHTTQESEIERETQAKKSLQEEVRSELQALAEEAD
ncbi:MAG: SMC-Scp complex subunit ScpB [Gammaproteobacteria bacterium]|nr:SMC-Scp complex subunit ScpB [Gammaproteobacteria bacterium]